jgi:ACS family D-galactonate transporter-like MFS transporter
MRLPALIAAAQEIEIKGVLDASRACAHARSGIFTQGSIGLLGALPAGASVILVIAAGWCSQRLLARGVSSRVARGIFGGACVSLGGAALAIMPYEPGISAKIALTTIGVARPSVIYVIGNAVVSEIAPVAQRGALLAIGTAVSTSSGLLAPYVMGSVVETAATPLNGFNTGFTICGVIMLVGGVIGMALMHPERETMGGRAKCQAAVGPA